MADRTHDGVSLADGPFAQPDEERRFGGLARLYGTAGAARIRAAHVVVVGVGGVGSWAAEALARSGVGRITLIDMDHVAESNVNRQAHALTATLGQAKVQAMAERMHGIHPMGQVDAVDDFVTPENWPALLPEGAQAVVDACDAYPAKLAMASWALGQRDYPFICVGAAGGKREPWKTEVGDLATVTHDPLLAKLRYRLRREAPGRRPGSHAHERSPLGLTCVFSREAVARPATEGGACAPSPGAALACAGYGSSVAVTASFGFAAAGWVMERLARARDVSLR